VPPHTAAPATPSATFLQCRSARCAVTRLKWAVEQTMFPLCTRLGTVLLDKRADLGGPLSSCWWDCFVEEEVAKLLSVL